MKTRLKYRRHRFPPQIISYAVRLYHRFTLSFRDVEDLLAERGITVSYEAIRLWCDKFGPGYARTLRRRQGCLGDTIDILVQRRRDRRAAKRFFRKLLKGQGWAPRRLVTDKLRSYGAAHRDVFPSVTHSTGQYENNRAEVSHQPTRQQERQMRRFKSEAQAQRFLAVHSAVQNLFRYGRHLLRATNHRILRDRAFDSWRQVTCAY